MKTQEIKSILNNNRGYLKWGAGKLAKKFNTTPGNIKEIKRSLRDFDTAVETNDVTSTVEYKQFLAWKEKQKELKVKTKTRKKLPKPFIGGNPDNVLVIGDLHEPFCLDGYLEFCREQQEKFNCGSVKFIGDVIDNHYSSYHEADPDGYGAGEELERAVDKLANWYKVFPEATVFIGNHDRIVYRKATSSGVSRAWIRDLNDALGTPNWNYIEEEIVHGVCYNHGEGGTAKNRMKVEHQSQVQGHLHSQAYVEYSVGPTLKIFGMQVGCGVDRTAYAMAYGKNYKKPIISCGVVLNKGKLPIVLPMELK